MSDKKAEYIGCAVLFILGLIFPPYITIPVGILYLIGTIINAKKKSQDEQDLEDIKAALKKNGDL